MGPAHRPEVRMDVKPMSWRWQRPTRRDLRLTAEPAAASPAAEKEAEPEVVRHDVIAASAEMKAALTLADHAARSGVGVLIIGESGTGKEVIARYIHEQSRRTGEFVPVNLGALPEGLVESELFGHTKGAFTGAAVSRFGLVETADRGTLFLDEIGDMPPAAQVKLLRFLDDSRVRSVGRDTQRKIDFRVVAATNVHLSDRIASGSFRSDLYYRLAVLLISIPPLRRRREDIQPFIKFTLERLRRHSMEISDEVMGLLMAYPWPGNLRELRNAIERACAVADKRILLQHLPSSIRGLPETWEDPDRQGFATLAQITKQRVLFMLHHCNGCRVKTAQALGVNTSTLYRWMVSWGLQTTRTGTKTQKWLQMPVEPEPQEVPK
jgi:transcriptional regulator with PAS, ATPase and Fis domain